MSHFFEVPNLQSERNQPRSSPQRLPSQLRLGDNQIMLFPRYSLRAVLTTVSFCSVFFVVSAFAFRGHGWAVVIAVAAACVPTMLWFQLLGYAFCRAFLRLVGSEHLPARTSQGAVRTRADGGPGE